MEEITVEVGEPSLSVGFTGRWLVEPDSDATRTGEGGHDAGAYWGIALTKARPDRRLHRPLQRKVACEPAGL